MAAALAWPTRLYDRFLLQVHFRFRFLSQARQTIVAMPSSASYAKRGSGPDRVG
jgi:hypothetical protein